MPELHNNIDQNIEFIDCLMQDYIKKEKICHSLNTLNKLISNNHDLIMYVNIRSLNANFDNL